MQFTVFLSITFWFTNLCKQGPPLCYSMQQNVVDMCMLGSECSALMIAVELIEGLRYKIRLFGIPIEDLTNAFAIAKRSPKLPLYWNLSCKEIIYPLRVSGGSCSDYRSDKRRREDKAWQCFEYSCSMTGTRQSVQNLKFGHCLLTCLLPSICTLSFMSCFPTQFLK